MSGLALGGVLAEMAPEIGGPSVDGNQPPVVGPLKPCLLHPRSDQQAILGNVTMQSGTSVHCSPAPRAAA